MKQACFLPLDATLPPQLAGVLAEWGWQCHPLPTWAELLPYLHQNPVQLLLIEGGEHWQEETELCRQLRWWPESASSLIVFLMPPLGPQAHQELSDAGADRVWDKTMPPAQLAAHLRALLLAYIRRTGLQFDPKQKQVNYLGRAAQLSPTEYKLLLFLARHPGRYFSATALHQLLWQGDSSVAPLPDQRQGLAKRTNKEALIRNHIKNIRNKLQSQDFPAHLVSCLPKQGYSVQIPST
jgi:two-component system phosphate regulon response regulator PhoB